MAQWLLVARLLLPVAIVLIVAIVPALLTRGMVWDGLSLVSVDEVTR